MSDDEVRPFHLHVSDAELTDLRDRLRRTRWPDAETSPGWSQGPPIGYLRELVRYWADEYDWRRVEAELNGHQQFLTEIDGLDVHFLHVRSPRADARPLVITHGWPGSVLEPLAVIDALTDPKSSDSPAFHVVAPSLPGFGFSGKPTGTGWGVRRTADAWAILMQRLGYDRCWAAGGDWGGRVTQSLATRHPDLVAGLHTYTPYPREPVERPGTLTELEGRWVADTRRFAQFGSGYSLQQSTRPQTVAYALADSPVAQLAWILDKIHAWTDHAGEVQDAVSGDQILDMATLYWLTDTGGSSARFYWENSPAGRSVEIVEVPAAITVFPADIEKFPRHWLEPTFPQLTSWSEAERGGHFPALEVPTVYVAELRAAFGSMELEARR